MKTIRPESTAVSSRPEDSAADHWLTAVREKVNGLKYGTVQVIVHDGRVTQIESTERIRFERPAASHGRP